MAVDAVVVVEVDDLVEDLAWGGEGASPGRVVPGGPVGAVAFGALSPEVVEGEELAEGPKAVDFAEAAEEGEGRVGGAHVGFVGLGVRGGQGFEFLLWSGWVSE